MEGHQDVIKIFQVFSNKENINTELLAAVRENNPRLVLGLVIAGAEVETKDGDDNTVLHLAADEVHESVVKILTSHGIDVKIQGKYNYTQTTQP